MPSFSSAIQVVDDAIKKIQQRIPTLDVNSANFLSTSEHLTQLLTRRTLLTTFSEEMVQRMEKVHTDINKQMEKLESQRKERIANIKHEYGEKLAKLPKIAGVQAIKEVSPTPPPAKRSCTSPPPPTPATTTDTVTVNPTEKIENTTIDTVKKYMEKYFNDYEGARNDEINFFLAAKCCSLSNPINSLSKDSVFSLAWSMQDNAGLRWNTPTPLSLTVIDQVIHSGEFIESFVAVFDTSLRVILTNAPRRRNVWGSKPCYLLIYDFDTKKFAPVPSYRWQKFCRKCYSFKPDFHTCKPYCPLCHLTDPDPYEINCYKTDLESAAIVCPKCDVFCQTNACFKRHTGICPCRPSPIHDNILESMGNNYSYYYRGY